MIGDSLYAIIILNCYTYNVFLLLPITKRATTIQCKNKNHNYLKNLQFWIPFSLVRFGPYRVTLIKNLFFIINMYFLYSETNLVKSNLTVEVVLVSGFLDKKNFFKTVSFIFDWFLFYSLKKEFFFYLFPNLVDSNIANYNKKG